MTQRAFGLGGFVYPSWLSYPGVVTSITMATGTVADAANEGGANLVIPKKTGTITKVYVHIGTQGAGTAGLLVRLETLTAGSQFLPSGTLVNTDAETTISPTGTDDNKWMSGTLTAGAAVTAGVPIAVKWSNPAGSPSITVPLGISTASIGPYSFLEHARPYTSATWQNKTDCFMIIIEYSDGDIQAPTCVYPYAELPTTLIFDNNYTIAAGSQAGMKLVIPFTGTLSGISANAAHSSSTRPTYTYKLYLDIDTTNPAATTYSTNPNIQHSISGSSYNSMPFTSPLKVTKGQVVYVVIEPSTLSGTMYAVQFKSGFLTDLRPYAAGEVIVTRTGTTGAFTESSNDEIGLISVIYSNIDDGVGPGSASFNIGGL